MSTLSEKNIDLQISPSTERSNANRLVHRIGMALLTIVGSVLALITLLPVALLPFVTAVPTPFFLLLAAADLALLYYLFFRADTVIIQAALLLNLVLFSALAVLLSQWYATTPPILDAAGQPILGSIAELQQIELNGRDQWLTIRGQDQTKPVLLFLAGGPGGSQIAATRKLLADLEQHFIVVNWDQPGAGKSYRAADFNSLIPQDYIDDGLALTQYLRERFGQQRIYIVGESWGSLLGIWMVQQQPEQFHAFAGLAQMVAFLETDTYDYNLALEIAAQNGDSGTIQNLQQQGPPPYYGDGVALKVTRYIMVLSQYMMHNPQISGPGYDTFGDIAAVEYGLYDKINYVRGLLKTMDHLWPQLWDVDLRQEAAQLDVPIFFLEGRHDVNAPPYLVEDYLQKLQAPYKELIWFEHSGHSPWVDESDKVVNILVSKFHSDQE